MKNDAKITIKKGNFTTTFNDIFNAEIDGQKLKPEVWGLYVYMLSLPEDWDFTIRGLAQVINAGKNKIQRILQELEQAGFIKREQKTFKNGKFQKIEYTILDQPVKINSKKQTTKNEAVFLDSPCPQKPYTENRDTKQSTKEQKNNDKLKIKANSLPNFKYHFLTEELINKKIISVLDYDLKNYNDMFIDFDKQFGIDLVLDATRYVVSRFLKTKPKLNNQFRWFEEAIENNLLKLQRKENNQLKIVDPFFENLEELGIDFNNPEEDLTNLDLDKVVEVFNLN